MPINLTKQSFFTYVIFVFLLGIIIWESWIVTSSLLIQNINIISAGTSLGEWIDSLMISSPLVNVISSSLLMIINALLIARMCIRSAVSRERNLIPALIYVIVSAGFFNSFFCFRPLLVSFFVIVATNLIFRSLNIKTVATGAYLQIGFYLGLAAMIYAPAISFFLLLFIGLLIFRSFSIKEWVVAIVGYALPIFILFYINWVMGTGFDESFTRFVSALITQDGSKPLMQNIDIPKWISAGTISVVFLLSIVKFVKQKNAYMLKGRKAYYFFGWTFIVAICMMVLMPCGNLYMLPILATPVAGLLIYFNAPKPSFIRNMLYLILIISAITVHILPIIR